RVRSTYTLAALPLSSLQLSHIHANEPLPPQIYTLSLHDALPISEMRVTHRAIGEHAEQDVEPVRLVAEFMSDQQRAAVDGADAEDRKSTRLNSSHVSISYAVFCLKKKKQHTHTLRISRHHHRRTE